MRAWVPHPTRSREACAPHDFRPDYLALGAATEALSRCSCTRPSCPFSISAVIQLQVGWLRRSVGEPGLSSRRPLGANLLRDLARGVGLQDYFLLYTDPSKISQKV